MMCRFTIADGIATCKRCARPMATRMTDPQRIKRECLVRRGQDGLRCIHIGEHIRTEGCQTCRGSVKVKIYECAAKGACKLAECQSCELFTAAAE